MSMSNNIAEGSGGPSAKEFARFLDIARRSTFENANIVIILFRRKLLEEKTESVLLEALDHLSRRITNFKQPLRIDYLNLACCSHHGRLRLKSQAKMCKPSKDDYHPAGCSRIHATFTS